MTEPVQGSAACPDCGGEGIEAARKNHAEGRAWIGYDCPNGHRWTVRYG